MYLLLHVQVSRRQALFAHVALLLFQASTVCFIYITVITCVGRRPAAAPGMKAVFFPSSLFNCESLKLPSLNTVQNLGELQL